MSDNLDNEASDTIPMNPQDTPADAQPQVAPETPSAQAAPVAAPAVAPDTSAYAAEPVVSATKSGVTISHRALWVTGAVVLSLALLAAAFGFGVGVGRHSGPASVRGEAGAWRLPNSGGDGWQGQSPHSFGDGRNDGTKEYGHQNDRQNWRGPGYRKVPRGQLPTATPSL